MFCLVLIAGCGKQEAKLPEIQLNDLPRVDSSTGAYPMAVAIANNALGIENSDELFKASQTVQAHKNVIEGTKDIAIAPMPGKEQLDYAIEKGVELEFIHVANNAFVFLVNEDNPVDNLTSEQVRDIYSGKIKNWKEVGGRDEAIVPLQRNHDSGSQTAMIEFMGETKLTSPITEYTIGGMGMLIEGIVKPFDGSQSAIGYSFLYFVNQMIDVDGIKLLAIDGVKPTNETIIDGTYPEISPYYATIRKDSAEDSIARRWAKYMISETGQNVIEQAKYVRAIPK